MSNESGDREGTNTVTARSNSKKHSAKKTNSKGKHKRSRKGRNKHQDTTKQPLLPAVLRNTTPARARLADTDSPRRSPRNHELAAAKLTEVSNLCFPLASLYGYYGACLPLTSTSRARAGCGYIGEGKSPLV
jgi:hypothetical protein